MVRAKWEDWYADGEVVLTKSGKRKRVSYDVIATWVSESWKAISADLVVKAMTANGLTFDDIPSFHCRLAKLLKQTDGAAADEYEEDYALVDDTDADTDTLPYLISVHVGISVHPGICYQN